MYGITVAAELAGMSVQALRLYERKGLVAPARTGGGSRRYSDADIARLRRIGDLIAEGINLTGIARVLGLEADNADLHADNEGLRAGNAHLRAANTPSAARDIDDRVRGAEPVPTPESQETSWRCGLAGAVFTQRRKPKFP